MQSKRSMSLIGTRRTNVLILSVILVVAAITASLLIWQRSATSLPAQLSTDTLAARPALDQHERHAAGFSSNIYALLDQHERHSELSGAVQSARPALDQHERHAAGFSSNIYAPLDQHERHSKLFGAPGGTETGARDRWWADRKEDDANAARDAWWLDK